MVQWLRFRASPAEGMGSLPSWGTKIPHAVHLFINDVFYLVHKNCLEYVFKFHFIVYFFFF